MKKTDDKKIRNRYFEAILYPEDENYINYMENIKKFYQEVTYITHDRDIDENGDIKKPHTHILFKVGENARHKNKIAEEIGLPENYLTGVNKKAMLMYLIHYNNPEKTQYSTLEVKGELVKELERIITSKIDKEIRIEALYNLIKEKHITKYNDLLKLTIEFHLTETLRQNQFIISKLIEEEKRIFK